ncbi:hypothetical protein AMTR_s00042p00112940 [Amborella trichopoda]|uniref:Uncharacterized protein n=1 Tax=Amborella trichopoda TaxID=13333 RepID=W1P7B5_AMBTC|nr:hypothetical protein AMTR_s00042p00112940 [Amborella trichopoda]
MEEGIHLDHREQHQMEGQRGALPLTYHNESSKPEELTEIADFAGNRHRLLTFPLGRNTRKEETPFTKNEGVDVKARDTTTTSKSFPERVASIRRRDTLPSFSPFEKVIVEANRST